MTLTIIILTFNEERHIERAMNSVRDIADRLLIVDSGSSDRTLELARGQGATVVSNAWINHAIQFNFALEQLPKDTEWVMRLDADEVVTPELSEEIATKLSSLGSDIAGVYIPRRTTFLREPIRFGGLYPVHLLRIFRFGKGWCENRWMDEHIRVSGKTISFSGELIDDNVRPLTWWIEKHNMYANREVVDILNRRFNFMPHETIASLREERQAGLKRWFKENVYAKMPSGFRAFSYFFYRYVLRLGFLDGKRGLIFHVLQGFWYRFLVDAKLFEVEKYMNEHKVGPEEAIEHVLGIKIP